MEKPARGGEKRTAVWASHPEEGGSDDGVAPPVCDPRVVPHRWVVCERCTPSGSAVDTGHDVAAQVQGAARAAERRCGGRSAGPAWGAQYPANYCATSQRDSIIIAPVSAYHRANYAYRYSRFRRIAE